MKIVSAEQVMTVEGGHYYRIGFKCDCLTSPVASIKREHRNGEMSFVPIIVITLDDGTEISSDASHFIITEVPEPEENDIPI